MGSEPKLKRLTRCRKCGRCKETTPPPGLMCHVKLHRQGNRQRWGNEDCGPFDVYELRSRRPRETKHGRG